MRKGLFCLLALAVVALTASAQTEKPTFLGSLRAAARPCILMQYQAHLDAQNDDLAARVSGEADVGAQVIRGREASDKIRACYADAQAKGAATYKTYIATAKNDTLKADARDVFAAWNASLGVPPSDDGSPTLAEQALRQAGARMDADELL